MLRNIVCPRCSGVILTEDIIPKQNKAVQDRKSRTLCGECKNVDKTIDLLCWKCLSIIDIIPAKRSLKPRKSRYLCESCKKQVKKDRIGRITHPDVLENNRQRMLTNNPNPPKPKKPKLSQAQGSKITSERMKTNNPMKNPDVVSRMRSTVKKRVESGEIAYKKGPEHHLWKGNRDFNNTCRVLLYPTWTKPILERDRFCCTRCNSRTSLQVHHIRPLREIIGIIKDRHGIKTFSAIDSSMWFDYIQEIIDEHRPEDGITVCGKCHETVDSHYHGAKNEN